MFKHINNLSVVDMYQSQNTLFGPHDTSRVSESDLHPFSSDGNLDTCAVLLYICVAVQL